MPSILERLEYWVNQNPRKLLYAFLDLRGRETESYTYESFLQRINTIAGHLRALHRFENKDCLLRDRQPERRLWITPRRSGCRGCPNTTTWD